MPPTPWSTVERRTVETCTIGWAGMGVTIHIERQSWRDVIGQFSCSKRLGCGEIKGLTRNELDRRASIQTDESYHDDVTKNQHQPLKIRVRQTHHEHDGRSSKSKAPSPLLSADAIQLTKVKKRFTLRPTVIQENDVRECRCSMHQSRRRKTLGLQARCPPGNVQVAFSRSTTLVSCVTRSHRKTSPSPWRVDI